MKTQFSESALTKNEKTSNENIDLEHGMFLIITVTTLKNQILRVNIKKQYEKTSNGAYFLNIG